MGFGGGGGLIKQCIRWRREWGDNNVNIEFRGRGRVLSIQNLGLWGLSELGLGEGWGKEQNFLQAEGWGVN